MKMLVLGFFVLLAMAGSFFAGNYFIGGVGSADATPPSDILEEARKAVAPVVLPTKPAGHSVTTTQQKTIQVPEVHVENQMITVGGLVKTMVPKVVTTLKTVTTDVPVTTLVDASPAEVAKWDLEVKALQEKYEKNVRDKVAQITQERQHQRNVEVMEETKTVVTDMIIPLITALAGLIGAMAAFRYGTKAAT
jgi:hypothetical protein